MKYVLDASVYVSLNIPSEVHFLAAKKLWSKCGEQEVFHVPVIFSLEIISAFARRKLDSNLIVQQEKFLTSGPKFLFYQINSDLVKIANDIIKHSQFRSADAIYLALTHQLKGTLLTLDNEMVEAKRRMSDFKFAGSINTK